MSFISFFANNQSNSLASDDTSIDDVNSFFSEYEGLIAGVGLCLGILACMAFYHALLKCREQQPLITYHPTPA